jgi:hypothetical protein
MPRYIIETEVVTPEGTHCYDYPNDNKCVYLQPDDPKASRCGLFKVDLTFEETGDGTFSIKTQQCLDYETGKTKVVEEDEPIDKRRIKIRK